MLTSHMLSCCLQARWQSWAQPWGPTWQNTFPSCCRSSFGSCAVMTRATGAMRPTVLVSSVTTAPTKCRTTSVSCCRCDWSQPMCLLFLFAAVAGVQLCFYACHTAVSASVHVVVPVGCCCAVLPGLLQSAVSASMPVVCACWVLLLLLRCTSRPVTHCWVSLHACCCASWALLLVLGFASKPVTHGCLTAE